MIKLKFSKTKCIIGILLSFLINSEICQLFGQTNLGCDSVYILLSKRISFGEDMEKITRRISLPELEQCILDTQYLNKTNYDVLRNIAWYGFVSKVEKAKERTLLLLSKIQPALNKAQKENNQNILLSKIYPRIKLGDPDILENIRLYFDQEVYYRVLFYTFSTLSDLQKNELEQVFYNPGMTKTSERIVESKKWLTALLLAREGHYEAENYLINTIQAELDKIKNKRDRSLIYDYGPDLVYTKNYRLINYLVDEFLMSDYEWWDWDTGYSDFWAAFDILSMIIDDPVFEESLLTGGKSKKYLRKWFKEHRDNYTFKP